MNGELLNVLTHIEREKGIRREVLIQAVEAALLSAARKTFSHVESELSVRVDNESGEIKVFSGETQLSSDEFGRIAAQTAKQVIIQRIREAEREVIYTDFSNRVGEITNGIVHRFDREGVVIDLGRTEAILPKQEQLPKEQYRQGAVVRAYILEVRKTTKGPQIILSRTHPGIVKKLFELEVPEIYEGIVEIKSVAREPGDRTKIAVWSKDEKVDCVGACVGMRGSRVKDVVRELHGEKIDIIRWSGNVRDYITAALSPAEVSDMKVYEAERRVEVIVENDQLSLAIGKRGQNVRLASQLTGWNIDIRSKSQIAKLKTIPLRSLPGVGPKIEKALKEAGFESLEKILAVEAKDLVKVPGIGTKTAERIIEAAKKLRKESKGRNKESEASR